MRPRSLPLALLLVVVAACSGAGSSGGSAGGSSGGSTGGSGWPGFASSAGRAGAPTAEPARRSIEGLRYRAAHSQAGPIEVLDRIRVGSGFTKHNLRWTSGGQPMTGTISIPSGAGPFPVVIVNHGRIPSATYRVGQDSGIFGDPLAAHGFIAIAPNYPGYAGSGRGESGRSTVEQIAVTEMDLIASLGRLAQADPGRVAVVGHSQGGGVSQLLMVSDPRVRAVVLYAPISSDEVDSAERYHARTGSWPSPNGDPALHPEAYAMESPRRYFAAGQPPVLLIQGTGDHIIPAQFTRDTYDALIHAGVKAELLLIPGADHDLTGTALADAVAAEEAWIRTALGSG